MSLPPSKFSPLPGPLPHAVVAEDDYADPGARAIDLSERPIAENLREIMASSPRLPRELPPPLSPAAPPFKNRHWTLAVVGLVFLFAAFALAGESVWRLAGGGLDPLDQDGPERAHLLIGHPLWAAWGLATGLGLVFARRWARHLVMADLLGMLVWVAASALAIGLNTWPDVSRALSPIDDTPAWRHLAELGGVALIAGLLLALLKHANVRRTCEQAQPAPDWTDRRSPPELLLLVLLVGRAGSWAGLASHPAWPCWGDWRVEDAAWVWGGGALAAAVAAFAVGRGRPFGVGLAVLLATAHDSSVFLTALKQPPEGFTPVWDGWGFLQRGGLAYTLAGWLVTVLVAGSALRAQRRRRHAAAPPPAPPLCP